MTYSTQTAPRLHLTAQRSSSRASSAHPPRGALPRAERESAASSRARTSLIDLGWGAADQDKWSEPQRDSHSSFSRFTRALPAAFSRASATATLPGIGPMLAPGSRARSEKELRRSKPGHATLFDVDVPQHLPELSAGLPSARSARWLRLLPIAIVAVAGFAIGFGLGASRPSVSLPSPSSALPAQYAPPAQSALSLAPTADVVPMAEALEAPAEPPTAQASSEVEARPADSAVRAAPHSGNSRAPRGKRSHIAASDNPY